MGPRLPVVDASQSYAIFVPAFEAEATIARVIARIPDHVAQGAAAVLVRDDGSKDGTWDVLAELERTHAKLLAVRSDRNLGFGGTNKAAFAWMLAAGIDAFAVLHGDLQYDPESVEDVLAPILNGTADIVLGSRMSGHPLRGGMPIERWLCNKFLTWRMNRRLNLALTDYHTGLVAFRTNCLRSLDIETLGDGHELTAEILVRASLAGLVISERTIATHYLAESRSLRRFVGARYAWNVLMMLRALRKPGREAVNSHGMTTGEGNV